MIYVPYVVAEGRELNTARRRWKTGFESLTNFVPRSMFRRTTDRRPSARRYGTISSGATGQASSRWSSHRTPRSRRRMICTFSVKRSNSRWVSVCCKGLSLTQTCIYDEGHKLKSCTTKAYQDLMMIKPKWRLLLTGTPLQNNLQELVSLLMFIHKDTFADAEQYLRAIFKSQGASVLSQQRVSRARTMLTPFVLRRRKAHVLTLPPKIERVQHCEMTPVQAKLYRETLGRSKKVLEELDDDALEEAAAKDEDGKVTKATKASGKKGKETKVDNSSSHILMDLRKAASHPLLFRRHYTDAKLKQLARACLNTPQWCDSNYDYVVEDLQVRPSVDPTLTPDHVRRGDLALLHAGGLRRE